MWTPRTGSSLKVMMARICVLSCALPACLLSASNLPTGREQSAVQGTRSYPLPATTPAASAIVRVVTVGKTPMAIAIAQRLGHAFVVNAEDGTVSMLNTATGVIMHTERAGNIPRAIAVDDTSKRVFLLNAVCPFHPTECPTTPGTVSVLNGATGVLLRTTRVGVYPSSVVVDERTNRAFIANLGSGHGQDAGSISVLDASTGALLRSVTTVDFPGGLALDVRTNRVFVSNTGIPGSASILDASTGALLRTVPLAITSGAIIAAERTGRVFVAGATADRGRALLYVLDATTGSLLRQIPFGGVAGGRPTMAIDEQTDQVFTICAQMCDSMHRRGGSVSRIDARTGAVKRTVPLPAPPWSIMVAQGTGQAFILSHGQPDNLDLPGARVTVLATRTAGVLRMIDLGASFSEAIAVDGRTGHVFVVTAGVPTAAGISPPGHVTILAAAAMQPSPNP